MYFKRFLVTNGKSRQPTYGSNVEGEAKDFMYGTSDQEGGKVHQQLWDMRTLDENSTVEPKLIDEIKAK